jgi:hypothetical protein
MRVLIISGVGIEFPLGAGALFGEIVGSAWRTVATTAWLHGDPLRHNPFALRDRLPGQIARIK